MKALNYLLMLGSLVLLTSQLFAQGRAIVPVERPQGSRPQSFYVNVSVDHENHVYEAGDLMEVTVESSKAGYLYLLYKDAGGNVTLLFPNSFHSENRIEGNKKVLIPNASMEFDLKTMPPFGKETLQAIVTLKPIEASSLTSFRNGQTFNELSSRQLTNLREEASRAIGVVGRNQEEGDNDLADCVLEITTVEKGQVPQTRKNRFFVGICVAKYSDTRIPALPACEKDLEAMGRFFNASSAVDADESRVYINESATKEKIKDLFFNYLPNHTKPGDEVIIYWTGHGGHCSDTNGDEEDDKFDETLILYDSKRNDPGTQLIDDDFGRWVQNLSGRKVLFILDTCHSGGIANRAKGLDSSNDWDSDWSFGFNECATMKDIGQSNLALIASCAKSEVSLVRDEQDMSVMTWYIMEHLKKDSGITHEQLYKKIKPQVHDYVKETFGIDQNVTIQDDFETPMIVNP